jgi:hypothetical protein
VPQQPLIAFCTTCKGRLPHLRETLPKNIADNLSYPNLKFIVLDYSSDDGLSDYVNSNHSAEIESGRLALYQFRDAPKFHMAHAKNMAHRCGLLHGAEILVNVDADNFTGEGFAHHIAAQCYSPEIFLQAMWNRWVPIDGKKEWVSESPSGEFVPPVPKGSNGRIVVSARAFLKAGGYNEKFDSWGPDDKDFNIRIRRLGYAPKLIDSVFLETILHNDRLRFREYPHVKNTKGYNFAIKVEDSKETIANYGRVGMGTVYRDSQPISLGPLPTRIFGIGMHKTGTTSLHQAFQILGYDSGHWNNAHWAKAIWREMNDIGHSPTLERSYALSDLPIPLLYKELDRAYPGSKFILTIRPEDDWLRSVRQHWSNDNQYRHQWDIDPFTHAIHKALYGQSEFNETIFRERFRRHNTEVKEYFRDRPTDLLVMDISSGNCWPKLCEFLGRPIPDVAYPKSLISKVRHPEIDFQI